MIKHPSLSNKILLYFFFKTFLLSQNVEFFDDFSDSSLSGKWATVGPSQLSETGSYLNMIDYYEDDGSGPVLSSITHHTGYAGSISAEVEWLGYAENDNTTFHIILGSSNGNHVAFGLYNTESYSGSGDNQIWLYIYKDGIVVEEQRIDYPYNYGVFKLIYDAQSKTISAFYKKENTDDYITMPGSNYSHLNFSNSHWVTYICDNWLLGGPSQVSLDWSSIIYQEGSGTELTDVVSINNDYFNVKVDELSGGIMELKATGDILNTNFIIGKVDYPQYALDDSRWLGDIITNYCIDNGEWVSASTSMSDDIREISNDDTLITIFYPSDISNTENGIRDFELTETYKLKDDEFLWEMEFVNSSDGELWFGDIGLPLPFNQYWTQNQTIIHEKRVFRHAFIGLDNTYFYFQRPSGEGQYLLMTPMNGTKIEYYYRNREGDYGMVAPYYEGLYTIYPYSKNIGEIKNPEWFYPHTSLRLLPGEQKTLGFSFQWASDYEEMKQILYDKGFIDVDVVPGMVSTIDQPVKISLHTKININNVESDDSSAQINYLGAPKQDYHLYQIHFSKLGSNRIIVSYGEQKDMILEFFITDPIETLIKKRGEFIVDKQQQNNPGGNAYKAFMIWDLINEEQITYENHPELPSFFTNGTDDIGYGPPLFLADKNVYFPNEQEIAALDSYLNNHIWGYVQDTTNYGLIVYPGPGGQSSGDLFWRSYNYPHMINIYVSMYRIQKEFNLSNYLSAEQYLMRAYHTFEALFSMYMDKDGANSLGLMGESGFIRLVKFLELEGLQDEADFVRNKWTLKADRFSQRDYPYGSEMSQDATAYEAVHAMAKFSGLPSLAHKTNQINLANRSWQPVWHNYGSDNRWFGDSHYRLSYMTQLGAWGLLDYGLNFASTTDKPWLLRCASGAIMAGWATIHTTAEGESVVNNGAASWVFHTESGPNGMNTWSGEQDIGYWGALQSLASVVVNDPLFGWTCYGCELNSSGAEFKIIPKDGLRKRIHIAEPRFSIELQRDCFESGQIVSIDKNFAEISFSLDRQVDYFPLATTLEITGLNEYKYAILVNGVERSFVNGSGFNTITIGLDSLDKYYIRIVDASLINPHEGAVPENFKLYNNFPNPFNPFTKIYYDIPDKNFVEIIIYNLAGKKVATLSSEIKDPGSYNVDWHGQNSYGKEVSTGIYIYQLIADNYRIAKKMLLLK